MTKSPKPERRCQSGVSRPTSRELCLQLHRGALKNQAATKRNNAAADGALLTADLVTARERGGFKCPAVEFGRLWSLVLTPGLSAFGLIYKA